MLKRLMDLLRKRYQDATGCCCFEEQAQVKAPPCCDLSVSDDLNKQESKPGNPDQQIK